MLTPMPYYYGSNVYYVGDMVYVDGVPYVSASTYYSQAAEIVERGAPIHIIVDVEVPGTATVSTIQSIDEWLPMGTFAVLEDTESVDASIIVQLATNKSGHIAGNIIDMRTDEALPIYGAVDPETQRVAMRIEGRNEIIECGLWNLTQDALTVLIHIDENTTEERVFIRLSDPDQGELAP